MSHTYGMIYTISHARKGTVPFRPHCERGPQWYIASRCALREENAGGGAKRPASRAGARAVPRGCWEGMRVLLLVGGLGLLASAAGRAAEPPQIADATDREILEAFLQHVERSAAYCTPERMAKFASQPEDIVWQGSLYIKMPLVAHKLTAEAKYLDMFVERMDTLCACLTKGADGFQGWYGLPLELFRHPDHPERKTDVILTSFVVAGLMADFALVVEDDKALREKHGAATQRYLDLAQNQLVKKWDARGCFRELGKTGAVYTTAPGLKVTKSGLTQPHNKHSKIIRALLSLYKATGKDEYAAKAVKLGTRFKHCLTLKDDRYLWNYLDPSGAWDINPDKPGTWKHWIGSEHRGGYYNLSLSQAVLLHEHGLVFDRGDMDRFLKTQTTVCWNGDVNSPKWARVDGRPMDTSYLCGWLGAFDDKVHEMAYGAPAQQARLAGKDHPWQGGPTACWWLEDKYVIMPRWRGGEPAEADSVAAFLAQPENRKLVEELAFTVAEPSYKAPTTPGEMER